MGVREKTRDKEKEKQKEIENTTHAEPLLNEVEEAEDSPISERETVKESYESQEEAGLQEVEHLDESKSILMPEWGDVNHKSFMYAIPVRDQDLEGWRKEWGNYILKWMKIKNVHTISIASFITEFPFSDLASKIEAFKLFGEYLVEQDLAAWIGTGKRQLRVYWRPLSEWADFLYEWAIKNGETRLDVRTIVIQHDDTVFAGLPQSDLHEVMRILVKRNSAEWIDKEKGAIVFVV